MKPAIYVISGLGTDGRVFKGIKIKGIRFQFLKWLAPKSGESLSVYAERFSKQIKTKSPRLIGISFGGILAIEISKILPLKKLILISSIKTRAEMPPLFQLISKIKWMESLIIWLICRITWPAPWFFGATKYARLLKQILKDTNQTLLSWSIHQILHWKNIKPPRMATHIHGDTDRIFPSQYTKHIHEIKKGGHFMIMENASEISALLNSVLPKT